MGVIVQFASHPAVAFLRTATHGDAQQERFKSTLPYFEQPGFSEVVDQSAQHWGSRYIPGSRH